MVMHQASKAYFQAQASVKIAPVKLIQMLYERLLIHLDCGPRGFSRMIPKNGASTFPRRSRLSRS